MRAPDKIYACETDVRGQKEQIWLSYPLSTTDNFEYIRKELLRNGVNKKLLWTEYLEECRQSGEEPLMYSQFCYHIKQDEQNGVRDYLVKVTNELKKAMAYTGCTTLEKMDPTVIHTDSFPQ